MPILQPQPALRPEQILIQAYRENLVIALPFTIMAIKLLVRVIAREPAKDLFKSILVVPIDFVYIAMGILLASLVRKSPGLQAGYRSEAEMYAAGAFLLAGLIGVAIALNLSDRGIRVLWQKFIRRLAADHNTQRRGGTAAGAWGSARSKANCLSISLGFRLLEYDDPAACP